MPSGNSTDTLLSWLHFLHLTSTSVDFVLARLISSSEAIAVTDAIVAIRGEDSGIFSFEEICCSMNRLAHACFWKEDGDEWAT